MALEEPGHLFTWLLSKSIHINRIILRTFPIQGTTEFPPMLWLVVLPQETKIPQDSELLETSPLAV